MPVLLYNLIMQDTTYYAFRWSCSQNHRERQVYSERRHLLQPWLGKKKIIHATQSSQCRFWSAYHHARMVTLTVWVDAVWSAFHIPISLHVQEIEKEANKFSGQPLPWAFKSYRPSLSNYALRSILPFVKHSKAYKYIYTFTPTCFQISSPLVKHSKPYRIYPHSNTVFRSVPPLTSIQNHKYTLTPHLYYSCQVFRTSGISIFHISLLMGKSPCTLHWRTHAGKIKSSGITGSASTQWFSDLLQKLFFHKTVTEVMLSKTQDQMRKLCCFKKKEEKRCNKAAEKKSLVNFTETNSRMIA